MSGDGTVLRPRGVADIRDGAPVHVLEYDADALLVVTGLPGAGKSTLMRRCARAALADSQAVRRRWAARLPRWIGYPLYRPLVRAEHYWRLRRAIRAGGPLVVHDAGHQCWVRTWLSRTARRRTRPAHLLVLAVTEDEALAGQADRGRRISRYAQLRHARAAFALHHHLTTSAAPPRGFTSVVVLDRPTAARLTEIRFTAGPGR